MYKIIYHSHPDKPEEYNHTGKFHQLMFQASKEFKDLNDAIAFWLECSYPITKLSDLLKGKYDIGLLDIVQSIYNKDQDIQCQIEESEEDISSIRLQYELPDNKSTF